MEDSNWNFIVGETEINKQLLCKKRSLEESFQSETVKRRRLEQEVDKLKAKVQQQAQVIISNGPSRKAYLRKPLAECSCQQRHKRKKQMIEDVNNACKIEGYNPCSLELESRNSGQLEIFTLRKQDLSSNELTITADDKVHCSLYAKDKFSVSNEAYHELSVISDLPSISKIRRLTKSLNSNFLISNCPNNIIGV